MEPITTLPPVMSLPLGFGALTAFAAHRRNRSALLWFFLGLISGPIAWIVVVVMKKAEEKPVSSSSPKPPKGIRAISEGLWRLTLVLTFTLPLLVLLAGWLLDEARILSADEEVLIPLAIFGFVAPYIFVKTWLWVRQGFVQDHE